MDFGFSRGPPPPPPPGPRGASFTAARDPLSAVPRVSLSETAMWRHQAEERGLRDELKAVELESRPPIASRFAKGRFLRQTLSRSQRRWIVSLRCGESDGSVVVKSLWRRALRVRALLSIVPRLETRPGLCSLKIQRKFSKFNGIFRRLKKSAKASSHGARPSVRLVSRRVSKGRASELCEPLKRGDHCGFKLAQSVSWILKPFSRMKWSFSNFHSFRAGADAERAKADPTKSGYSRVVVFFVLVFVLSLSLEYRDSNLARRPALEDARAALVERSARRGPDVRGRFCDSRWCV